MSKFERAIAAIGMDFSQVNIMTVTALPGMPVTSRDVRIELRVFG